MKSTYAAQLETNEILPVAQLSEKGHPELNARAIPLVFSYANDERSRGIMRVVYAQQVFARPYFVAASRFQPSALACSDKHLWRPGTILSFVQMLIRRNLRFEPVSNDEIKSLLDKIYATPPELLRGSASYGFG